MKEKFFSTELTGRQLEVETGLLAQQAGGSVKVKYGETEILATATMSKNRREGMDYFPLMVDYEERYYAAGKIKGSRFIKREGRPSDEAVLNGRIIDRTIRPLFNHQMRNDVQIVITVLSIDKENDPIVPAVFGASLALGISNIPWGGPVAAVQVAKKGEEILINPKNGEAEDIECEVLISGTNEKINMIEASANEIPNREIIGLFGAGFEQIQALTSFQSKIIEEIGKEKIKIELTSPSEDFRKETEAFLDENGLAEAFYTKDKKEQDDKMENIKKSLKEKLKQSYPEEELPIKISEMELIFENRLDQILHDKVLGLESRPDGRGLNEVRKISCQVGVLSRPHGSALFQRGDTQALTVTTLGSPGDEQIIDTMELDRKKRYIHHYNFPSFCVGEVRPMRGPSRRDIGHGVLAEKALEPVIPHQDEFPYTILLVSEVLGSNGSSSMASTCGSTLSLMHAGVPIKNPVSGVAMGIIMGKDGQYKILTDIQGPEDHWGDMDFKVAGSKKGITAIQMDVKIDGITPDIIEEVLDRAYEGRMFIMEEMLKTIPEPNKELSPYAPRIINIKIDPEKIGEVIGSGGKIINEIIDKTGVQIDIEDDGSVFITGEDAIGAQKAKEWILGIVKVPEPGEIYNGRVTKVLDFGAFVEILPGKEGLVHISQLAHERTEKVEDVVNVGDDVRVQVKEVDSMGRLNLSIKSLQKKPELKNVRSDVDQDAQKNSYSKPNNRIKTDKK